MPTLPPLVSGPVTSLSLTTQLELASASRAARRAQARTNSWAREDAEEHRKARADFRRATKILQSAQDER